MKICVSGSKGKMGSRIIELSKDDKELELAGSFDVGDEAEGQVALSDCLIEFTSPEATMAAIEKFKKNKNFILICGGTNKELKFEKLAKKIARDVRPENLFLLEGSATDLLLKSLNPIMPNGTQIPYENLDEIMDVISQEFDAATIVFSPGCASFEKFKNEFDRGQTFNRLVRKYFIEK